MKVLITGANGFIGKNLQTHLREIEDVEILTFTKDNSFDELSLAVNNADMIFHIAGVNRPQNIDEFNVGNRDLTAYLCKCIEQSNRKIPVIFSSSIQANNDSPYGQSKREAEEQLQLFAIQSGNPIAIYRLPNVFGKWCKPNYNSVVATFCNNIINNKELQIHDINAPLHLVYIDDVIAAFSSTMMLLMNNKSLDVYQEVAPSYHSTVGELAEILRDFHIDREQLRTKNVGTGLTRALYSTYISYISPENFSYNVVKHEDTRGRFVEMLKTPSSGQFSYFTAHPGITRGGHYHHSKSEKFLVIQGKALFKFKNLITNEYYELVTNGKEPKIVDTATGWTHDITNIGDDELIVMLWANEVFDPENPDTFAYSLNAEDKG